LALAAISVLHFREKPPEAEPVRFSISLAEKESFNFAGRRFLVNANAAEEQAQSLTVVLNWAAGVKK